MVWWLEAADSAGPGPFYFTAPGTYSVGRKDCTIIIQADKSISRLHAEVSVETAPLLLPADKEDPENLPRCKIFLKDHSKFGTFVNKDADSQPLHSFPDKGAFLKEQDTVTFGLNKAVFRLQYVPIILCMPSSTFLSTTEVRLKAEAVGAYVFEQWNSQCTQLLVEETSQVTDLVIAAVLSRKPVLLLEWLQALLSPSSPQDQLPILSRYMPTLKMDSNGVSLPTPIAEPLAREDTLAGFTIFLRKGCLYRNHNLPALVNAAGGAVKVFTQDNLKDVAGLVQQNGLLVFPDDLASKDWLGHKLLTSVKHLHPTSEGYLVKSILGAKLDLSTVTLSPAASVDTGETVDEGDLQIEDDSATSVPQARVQTANLKSGPRSVTFGVKIEEAGISDLPKSVWRTSSTRQPQLVESEKSSVRDSTLGDSGRRDPPRLGASVETLTKQRTLLGDAERPAITLPKIEEPVGLIDEVKAEIIFNSGLIIRRDQSELASRAGNGAVLNFKRFKKGHGASGNSFSDLVPFAKEPYRESSYKQEMGDYVKQDRKRKEAEKLAEDLFDAEKLKRRRVTAVNEARASISGAR